MNRKNTKKLLSVILSLVMVLSYLPASSFAFAVDGEAGPVVEADSNTGNDTTVNTDTGADADTNTTDGSDQVTEGDKEDPPAVEEKEEKKDEQAEPKEEGKKVEANTEAKEPAKGSEDEEPAGPANGPKAGSGSTLTSNLMMDFVNHDPSQGTIHLIHKNTGEAVTPNNPAIPGEEVQLTIDLHEDYYGLQFDMDHLNISFPAGLNPPTTTITRPHEVSINDEHLVPFYVENTLEIDTSGNVTYTWDKDDPNYAKACLAGDITLNLSFDITVGKNAEEIKFSDDIRFPVKLDVPLTVTKTITGLPSFPSELYDQVVFELLDEDGHAVTDAAGDPITFTYGDFSVSSGGPRYKKIEGLLPGTYTVHETHHATVDGYTYDEGASTDTDTVTIDYNEEENAELTNVYVKDVGNLKLKKTFAPGSDLDSSMSTAQKKLINFKITYPDGTVKNVTYDKFNSSGEYVMNNVQLGTYLIEETSTINGNEYSFSYTYKVDEGPVVEGPGTAEPVVTKGSTRVVTFTNDYERKKGSLEIDKTFGGSTPPSAEQQKGVTFTVKGPGTNGPTKTYTYEDFTNGKLVINDLETGTYTVTEVVSTADFPGLKRTTTVQVDSGTAANKASASASVVTDATRKVTFTNNYEPVGKLVVTKNLTGNYFGEADNTFAKKRTKINSNVTFTLKNAAGQTVAGPISLSAFNSSGEYTFNNLAPGTYYIVESVGSINNVTSTTTVTVVDGSGSHSGSGTTSPQFVIGQNQTAQAEFTNKYDKDKGSIKIQKIIKINGEPVNVASLTEEQRNAITFGIYKGNTLVKQYTLNDIISGDYEPELLDVGTYTVKELTADWDYFLRETSSYLNGDIQQSSDVSVKVVKDGENIVKYENNYTRQGKLKITKEITGLSAADEAVIRGNITFWIKDAVTGEYILDENGNKKEFPLSELEEGIDIMPGSYIVEERNYEDPSGIYSCNTWSLQYTTGQQGGMRTDGTVSAVAQVTFNDTKFIDYWNEYWRPGPGTGFRVRKFVVLDGESIELSGEPSASDRAIDTTVRQNIRFRVYSGGQPVSGDPVLDNLTWSDLVGGILNRKLTTGVWTIEEYNDDVDGYLHDVDITITASGQTNHFNNSNFATFTLKVGGMVSVDFYNGYTETGQLTVKKSFGQNSELNGENLTSAQRSAIKFRVTGYKSGVPQIDDNIIWGPVDFTYADMEDGQKLFDDLPVGTYHVVETSNGGETAAFADYNCVGPSSTTGADVAITFGGELVKEFTNSYNRKVGKLIVKKEFAGDPLTDAEGNPLTGDEGKNKVTFTVVGYKSGAAHTAANIIWGPETFTYAEMPAAGKVFENVPTGDYEIRETNADYEYYARVTTVKVNGNDNPYIKEKEVTGFAVEEGDTNAVITNTYDQVGALIFKKAFDETECTNPPSASDKNNITFSVYKEGETDAVATFKYPKILAAGTEGYRILVTPGNYIIKETNANVPGFERTTTVKVDGEAKPYSDDDGVEGTVVEFTETEVAFTNKYSELGNLKITKTIDSADISSLNDDQKKAIKFTVTGPDPTMPRTFTYADMDENGEFLIEDIAAGTYQVEETVSAEDENTLFYGLVHRTYVEVLVGGNGEHEAKSVEAAVNHTTTQTVAFRNYYETGDELGVSKSGGGSPAGYITKDGSKYPYWKFTLDITNLQPSTTDNGSTEITDIYDEYARNLFKVVTDGNDLEAIRTNTTHPDPDAANANVLVSKDSANTNVANVEIEPNYDESKFVFKISGVNSTTAKDNTLTYYLIPRDLERLEALNTSGDDDQSTVSNKLLKKFVNVARYKELPGYDEIKESHRDYEYEKIVVSKQCLNYNAEKKRLEDDHGNPVDYAVYSVIINPEEMKLSTDGYIDVVDKYSENQAVDIDSVEVLRYDPDTEQTSELQEEDLLQKNVNDYKITLRLRDETCFRLTYHSILVYPSENASQSMTISNTVEVEGFKAGTEPVVTPGGSGSGNLYRIKLLKYPVDHMEKPLKGAEFKFYENAEDADLDFAAAKAAEAQGQTYDYPRAVDTFTTDENGEIEIYEYDKNGTSIGVHPPLDPENPFWYGFIESKAPDGFDKIDYVVRVRLAGHGEQTDYSQYIFMPYDVVQVQDPPFTTSVKLGAKKVFVTNGSNQTLHEGDFKFELSSVNGSPMPEGTDNGKVTVENDADGYAFFGKIDYDFGDVVKMDSQGNYTQTSKEYKYTVKELPPESAQDGWTYDLEPKEVTVTVSLSDDKKSLDVNVSGASVDTELDDGDTYHDVYFTSVRNVYNASGTWTPNIKKDLQGRPLEQGEFNFQILEEGKTDPVATGTNKANGEVEMTPAVIEYTLADLGEHHYTIHEDYTITTGDGIVKKAEDIDVTVNVSEKTDKDGTLEVTATPSSTLIAPYTMVNEFAATGKWHPKAEKTLTGALKLNAGDFKFELAAIGKAPMPEGAVDGKLELECDENGAVDFGEINYVRNKTLDQTGTYHYTIREVIPPDEEKVFGLEYDETIYHITVVVTNDKTNKLNVSVTCDEGEFLDDEKVVFTAPFENTYNPGPAKAQPGFDKGLEGVKPADELTFEFKLEKAGGQNGDFDYVKVEKNGALQPFATQTKTLTLGPTSLTDSGLFDEITFLVEGTYKFKITETPNTNGDLDPYIYYDPTVYTYTVVVTGEGKELQATGTYSIEGGESEQTAETAAFTNKYTPKPTVFTPKVHKWLNGEPTVKEKKFQFTMTPDADNPDGAYHGNTPFQGNASETIEIVIPAGQKDAEKAFETIDFKEAGTFVFHVEEKDTTQSGVTNDPLSLWDLTIEVEDQGGKLKVISSDAVQVGGDLSSTNGTVTFTNKYTPEPVKFAPPVKKVMAGEPLVADKTFTFTIEADSGNPEGGAVIANDTTSITVPAGAENKEGAFEAITFKRAGTYKFTIKEKKGDISQIGYSEAVSTLTVEIIDNDPEGLDVKSFKFTEAATPDGLIAEFTNTYTPTPVDKVVPVEKTVSGEPLVREKKFTFKLKPDTGNKKGGVFIGEKAFEGEAAEDTVVLTVPAGEINAHDVFKTLTFKKAGTYKFNVFEVIPADPDKYQGITYDETIGTVVIVVEDTDLKLEVTDMSFEDAVNDDGTAALFTNPYCPKPIEYTPEVEKTVSGHPTVAEKIFNFTLTPDPENKSEGVFLDDVAFEGEDAEDTTTVTVPAGEKTATAYFSELQFRKAGTYKFTVSELKEDEEGITYDEVVGTLTVTVTDADGHLVEEHVYDKAEVTDAKYAKFDNDYTPEPVVEILHGAKVIEGEPQKDEEFTFKLESGGNTAQLPDGSYIPNPMPEEDEVTIYGDGIFEFGDMTYEWPGEYYYKISEAAGDAMGFTYDTAVWSVKVTVTDMDGYLEPETTYTSDFDGAEAETQAVFTNTYTTGELKITKTVKGASGDKKFKFTVRLFDKSGDPLEGVYPITGDAEGEVVNGVGTVKLAHGEEAYVTEIPVDATWTVEEEDYANYKASCDKDHGTITVDKASESNWINTTGVDTGDHNTVGGYLGLFGTSIMALIAMIYGRRRRRENEE